MAANKAPRKKYRPRKVLVDAVSHAIERVTPITKQPSAWLLDRKIILSNALAELMAGRGTRFHVREVISHHNLAYALIRKGVATHLVGVCIGSNEALKALALRHQRTGSYVLNSTEIKAFQTLVEFFSVLMEVVTVGQIEDALASARTCMATSKDITKIAPHYHPGEPA